MPPKIEDARWLKKFYYNLEHTKTLIKSSYWFNVHVKKTKILLIRFLI